MAPALKVFRTPIGFHDAYVAAPSQKAALEAWGADANLFARGAAERVTDPKLTKEPLTQPGVVIKRPRASAAEHFAALSKSANDEAPARKSPTRPQGKKGKADHSPPPPRPRPSRAALNAAEQALVDQQQRAVSTFAALRKRQERILIEIERLQQAQDKEASRLERAIEKERRKYEAALARWRAS